MPEALALLRPAHKSNLTLPKDWLNASTQEELNARTRLLLPSAFLELCALRLDPPRSDLLGDRGAGNGI